METNRYSEEDINSYLQELLDNDSLNDSKEKGIVKLVIDKGFDMLTSKQKYVFEKALEPYITEECTRCGLDIPWCEMSAAEDNGGKCSWCQQLGRNDDN